MNNIDEQERTHQKLLRMMDEVDPCDLFTAALPYGLDPYSAYWKLLQGLKAGGCDIYECESFFSRDPEHWGGEADLEKHWPSDDKVGSGTAVNILAALGADKSNHPGEGSADRESILDRMHQVQHHVEGRAAEKPAFEPREFEVTDRARGLAAYAIMEPADPAGECSTWLRAMFDGDDLLCTLAAAGDSRWNDRRGKWDPSGTGRLDLAAGEVEDRLDAGEAMESVFGSPNTEAGAWCTVNPQDGEGRGSRHTTSFRHLLLECDEAPLEQQLAAYEELRVPVAAVWYSGGKSIHAAVVVDAADLDDFKAKAGRTFDLIEAAGIRPDRANSDCSRLCRMPGFRRGDRWQRLLQVGPFEGARWTWGEWASWMEAGRPAEGPVEDDPPTDQGVLEASAIDGQLAEARGYRYAIRLRDGAVREDATLADVTGAKRRRLDEEYSSWIYTGGTYEAWCGYDDPHHMETGRYELARDPDTGDPYTTTPWELTDAALTVWKAQKHADAEPEEPPTAEEGDGEPAPSKTPEELLADACDEHVHGLWCGSDVVRDLAELKDAADPWPLDLQGLNSLIGGAVPGAVTVLLGRSGTGKTTMLVQEMVSLASAGHPVVILTGEQAASELVAKTLSSHIWATTGANAGGLQVWPSSIRRAERREAWSREERQAFEDAVDWYGSTVARNVFFVQPDGRPSLRDLRDVAASVAEVRGTAPAVGVDYLQILGPLDEEGARDPERLIVDKNMTYLRQLARDLEVPVWLISSMNRNSYAEGEVSVASAKESGGVEYGADVLLGLQAFGIADAREEAASRGEPLAQKDVVRITHDCFDRDDGLRPLEVRVLKNRDGPSGGHAPLTLHLAVSTYVDYIAPEGVRRAGAPSLMEKRCSLTL